MKCRKRYPLADFPELLSILQETDADMVVGARPRNHEHFPFSHRIAKGILLFLSEYLSNCMIPDLNSGMRVFRRNVAERFMPLYPQGFSFHITLGALCNGYLVHFQPISYGKRLGRSKLSYGYLGLQIGLCGVLAEVMVRNRNLQKNAEC